ncbi:PucR family transcriptional regulator ligand-binding domain-containing protein [Paenibacillus sp.]|jgi:purine catabolism regulator|uniref:PucR family transcriptional regulator n=1 Tax=Paenibacillus sp. TaxID=58172 RepID=UPI00281CDF01|nr:PucR family transcriptional regulator ligand-binding domain-containing protein [Paenibacillus sp.]MDR0270381.1 PucR family transcriptional regulator ligand-binding domain-containing protein [Paenibacillus sp.]
MSPSNLRDVTALGGFTLSIRDVLERPVFQRARLIAGMGGTDRKVGWVHILEIANVAPYVTKNDLILTTGLWLRHYEQERLSYMQQLIRQEAAGLCVEFGTSIENIPSEVIELADASDFPLIVFEQPVRFVEITQDIHGLLINQQHQMLKDLEAYSRRLQQITLQSTDVNAILHVLYEYTGQQVVYHSTVDTNKFMPRNISAAAAEEITALYRGQVQGSEAAQQEAGQFMLPKERLLLTQPVICLGQTLAHVGLVIPSQQARDRITLLLDYTAKSLASLLLRMLFLEEKMLRDQNQLIQDILNHQIEDEEEARVRMGLRPPKQAEMWFVGGMMETEYGPGEGDLDRDKMESDQQDLLVRLRALLKRHALHNLLMQKGRRIYILCARDKASKDDTPLSLQQTIRKIVDRMQHPASGAPVHRLRVGFGLIRTRMTDIHRSFKEAEQVLEVTRSAAVREGLFYDQIGVYRLLKAIPAETLESFIRDQLGALMAYDQEHHLHLLPTLDMYLKCMGSKNDTAKALYIHRQTLYNRLDKLEEILGEDYLEPSRRICLEMALLALPLIT